MTRLLNGDPEWTFTTDYGVISRLDPGAISISKAGHHSEALDVCIADSLDSIDVLDRSVEWDWDNELGEEYAVSRKLIPVSDLVTLQ